MSGDLDKIISGGDILEKSQEKEIAVYNNGQIERKNRDMDYIASNTKKIIKTVLQSDKEKYESYLSVNNSSVNNSSVNINPFKQVYTHRYNILWYALFFVPWISIWKSTLTLATKLLSKTSVGTQILIKAKNGYSYVAKLLENWEIYFSILSKTVKRKFYKTIIEKVPIIRKIWMLKWVKVWNFNVKRVNNAWWDTFTYKLCDSSWKLITRWKTNFITFNNVWWKITFSGMNASWPAIWLWWKFLRTILNEFRWQTVYTTRQIKPSVNLMLERMWFLAIRSKKWQKLDKILFNRTSIFVPYGARTGLLKDLMSKQHLSWYTITQLKKWDIVKWNIHSSYYNVKYLKKID